MFVVEGNSETPRVVRVHRLEKAELDHVEIDEIEEKLLRVASI